MPLWNLLRGEVKSLDAEVEYHGTTLPADSRRGPSIAVIPKGVSKIEPGSGPV